jgi:hypothetical protein
MEFSADRRTVGRNWGKPPVRIEPVSHTLRLPGAGGRRFQLQAVGPDGRPMGRPKGVALDESGALEISANSGTMWYLLTQK